MQFTEKAVKLSRVLGTWTLFILSRSNKPRTRPLPPASFAAAFPTSAPSPTPTSKPKGGAGPHVRPKGGIARDEAISGEGRTTRPGPPTSPIIDQEGRQWRSPAQLASRNLVRDGLADLELGASDDAPPSPPAPFVATLEQHSLLLRGTTEGESGNEKKGRFVGDDERWMHRYDALCKFHERYGHTCVPFWWGTSAGGGGVSGDVGIRGRSDALDGDDVVAEEAAPFYDGDESKLRNAEGISRDEDDKKAGQSAANNIRLSSEFTEPYLRLELGHWVAQQRHYYKQRLLHGDDGAGRRLTPERIEYLDELNFVWDVKEARWEMQYHQLRDFVRARGHARVPQNSTLGHWCYKQRWHRRNIDRGVTVDWASIPEEAYGPLSPEKMRTVSAEERVTETAGGGKEYQGRPVSPLTPERRARLDALGFVWDAREQAWEDHFRSLCEYQRNHKTTRVPLKHGKLGVWVKKQREARKHRSIRDGQSVFTGKHYALTPDRIAKLDSINFEWKGHDYTWEEHYRHLLNYKEEHGHVRVGRGLDVPGKYPGLGSWLAAQRAEGRKLERGDGEGGRLTGERRDLLQRAGVRWDLPLARFEARVERLRGYRGEHGTLRVRPKHDRSLYSWVRKMTREYERYLNAADGKGGKKSLLEDDARREMLDELGFKEELVFVNSR